MAAIATPTTPISNDQMCEQLIDHNPNMLIPWYLMASYLYYIENESLLSDMMYDEICKRIEVLYPRLEHIHKSLVDVQHMAAGTGYYLTIDDYPERIKRSALALLKEGYNP